MFLSVSIAIYNAEKYLDKCIQSVLDQTENDYELILVDDGSTDRSVEICEKWQQHCPDKIRVIKKENSGSLLTRRVCLQESKGEYIYIMDADDYLIDPNAFKIIKETIRREQCDLVFFDCTSNMETRDRLFRFPFDDGTIFQNETLPDFRRFYLTGRGLKALWNKVFHRSLVDWDVDYTLYKDITNGTDCFQSTPIVSNAQKVYYLDRVFYFYRVNENENSIVHTFKQTIYTSARANFLRMADEAKDWGIESGELKQMLCQYYMRLASTSAYKVRLLKGNSIDKIGYLKTIGEDPLFKEYCSFSLTKPLSRRIIVMMLRLKMYKIMALVM